ncbi:hypothetical protein Bca4012_029769 [Brassica carinata]|uniref:Uncharacterized protein n=1 Tax=Brassica carinata TaxID=52824 RepID=A0A8X7RJ23_BRACI|nr:hypothetical protein Bca52824_048800 [Brassica carinata]
MQRGLDGKSSKTVEAMDKEEEGLEEKEEDEEEHGTPSIHAIPVDRALMKQPSKETLKKIRDISAIEEFGSLKLVLHFPDNT